MKVNEKLSPVAKTGLWSGDLRALPVMVCEALSSFVQVTVVPFFTTRTRLEKRKSLMTTLPALMPVLVEVDPPAEADGLEEDVEVAAPVPELTEELDETEEPELEVLELDVEVEVPVPVCTWRPMRCTERMRHCRRRARARASALTPWPDTPTETLADSYASRHASTSVRREALA